LNTASARESESGTTRRASFVATRISGTKSTAWSSSGSGAEVWKTRSSSTAETWKPPKRAGAALSAWPSSSVASDSSSSRSSFVQGLPLVSVGVGALEDAAGADQGHRRHRPVLGPLAGATDGDRAPEVEGQAQAVEAGAQVGAGGGNADGNGVRHGAAIVSPHRAPV